MPLYEFWCDTCGSFEQRRPSDEAGHPAHCPTCQGEARRIFSPPGLYRTSSATRRAYNRAEHGAEPRVERRSPPEPPANPERPLHAHGRPWMLGH